MKWYIQSSSIKNDELLSMLRPMVKAIELEYVSETDGTMIVQCEQNLVELIGNNTLLFPNVKVWPDSQMELFS